VRAEGVVANICSEPVEMGVDVDPVLVEVVVVGAIPVGDVMPVVGVVLDVVEVEVEVEVGVVEFVEFV
jgi:hypothetical protein